MNMTRLFPSPVQATLALPFLLVLAGCGDDLESRNAAAGLDEDAPVEARIESAPKPEDAASGAANDGDEGGVSPADGEEDGEETVVEAAPDDLIDSTEGFAPEPMDDAAGFDPSPTHHSPGQ